MKATKFFPIVGLVFLAGCASSVRTADSEYYGPVPVYMKGANGVEEVVPTYMRTADNSWEQVPVYMKGGTLPVVATINHDVVTDEFYQVRDRSRIIGKSIELSDAKVQKVESDYTFWVGPSMAEAIPVVLYREKVGIDPERRVEVREGQTLRISGVLKKTRDSANELKMPPSERREFLNNPYFVSATRVEGAAVTGE